MYERVRVTPCDLGETPVAATNAAATKTYAAVARRSHVLIWIGWSYSADPTGGKLTVENGVGTTVFEVDITKGDPGALFFPDLPMSVNTALIVTLAAGGAGVLGKLNVYKRTEQLTN